LLFGLTITRQLVDDLKRLLAKSPSITTLTLNAHPQGPGETEGDKVDLASLFEDAMEPPINAIAGGKKSYPFSSTLEYLSISATHFKLSPSCTPFLHALTGLLISGDSAHVQTSFWKSLEDSGIHLQKLNVGPLLQPIIDYLLSYSGLRDFVLDSSGLDNGDDESMASQFQHREYDENLAHQFFLSVLPMHQSTIQTVAFRNIKPGTWAITQSYLEGVSQCKNLESFNPVYHFPLEEDNQPPTIALVCKA
jgi:hypothetical protein